ncbi:MAG TPA: hypothetical protein VM223_23795 [Planctomycetota bacterium]|nr:hypothetical protein [Planctomycetota bacterium]
MANEWKWKAGPRMVVGFTAAAAQNKGTPCYMTSNVATVCADGGTVDLVAAEDTTSGSICQYIMPFCDVFEVKVATGTDLAEGAKVFCAATNTVDAGSASQVDSGTCINYDPASGGCALIAVVSRMLTPTIYS